MVLDFPLLDTRKTEENADMRKFISDIVVQILAYMAEAERKKNRESQRMGIVAMKERGEWERYGRPQVMEISEFKKAYEQVENGIYKNKELMILLGMKRSTYYHYRKQILQHKEIIRAKKNTDYLAMLDKSILEAENGGFVTKSLEELDDFK